MKCSLGISNFHEEISHLSHSVVFLYFFCIDRCIQKTKIMASGPISSWQIDGEKMKTVTEFIWGAPKSLQIVTAAMKLKEPYSLKGKIHQT